MNEKKLKNLLKVFDWFQKNLRSCKTDLQVRTLIKSLDNVLLDFREDERMMIKDALFVHFEKEILKYSLEYEF